MLQHIFSHCDQPTLFCICLASFACWQLAGPILYETVEINNLDALISLFFIVSFPSPALLLRGFPQRLTVL